MIIDVRVLDMLTNLNVFIKPKKKKKTNLNVKTYQIWVKSI